MQRSLSLGLQTILIRGLGTVPGPVVFGFVMDSTCLLWRQQEVTFLILSHLRISHKNEMLFVQHESGDGCDGGGDGDGRAGSCLIYDNAAMSLSVLGRTECTTTHRYYLLK